MKHKARKINIRKHEQQWYLHKHIAEAIGNLDRIKDAAEVKKDKPCPVPVENLPMVF